MNKIIVENKNRIKTLFSKILMKYKSNSNKNYINKKIIKISINTPQINYNILNTSWEIHKNTLKPSSQNHPVKNSRFELVISPQNYN